MGIPLSNLKLKWFFNNEWKCSQLKLIDEITYHCTTEDGIKVDLIIDRNNKYPNVSEKVTLDILIKNVNVLSGMKIIIPMKKSLKCTWKPHLSPLRDMVIGDKAFRSPVMIFEDDMELLAIVPDVKYIRRNHNIPHIMDYVLDEHYAMIGLCNYEEDKHVYYKQTPIEHKINETIHFKYTIVQWKKNKNEKRNYRKVEQYIWSNLAIYNFTKPNQYLLNATNLETYVKHTYKWAFDNWGTTCWQEFGINERKVGGVVFIVTAKQKPGYGEENRWREKKSIWNQAW